MADEFTEKYRESFIYSGAGQTLERILKVAVMVVVVRLLTQEHYGIYSLLTSVASIIGVVASWGWPAIYDRYVPELREIGDRRLLTTLMVKGIGSRIVITAGTIGAVLMYYQQIGPFLNIKPYRQYFEIFAVGIFATALAALLRHALNAALQHKRVYRVSVITAFGKDVLFVGVLLLGHGLVGILVVETIAMVCITVAFTYFVWHKLLEREFLAELRKVPGRIKKYGAFSYLNDIGNFFLDISIDTLVITKYLGVEAVAIYTVAAVIPKRIRKFMPTSMLRNVLEPMTFTSYARDRSDTKLNRIFNFLAKVNYALLLPLFGFLVLFGRELLALIFGSEYAEAHIYLIGLSFFFFAQMFPIGYVTRAAEKMHINAISKVFSIYNLVLDVVLIQWIGLLGVVLATGSAQLLKTIYVYWHTRRSVELTFPGVELAKLGLVSLTFFGGLKLLQAAFDLSVLWIAVASLPVIVALGGLVLRPWYFEKRELEWLEMFIGKVTKRERFVARVFATLNS